MGTKNTLFIGALLLMGKLSLASSLFIDLQEKNNTTYLITLNGNKTYQTSNDLTINHLNEGNTHLVIEEKTRFNNGWGTTTTNTFLAYDGHVYLPHNTKVNTQLFNNNLSITGSSVLYTPPVTSNPYPTPNPPTCGTPIPQRPPFGQWGQPQAMDDYTFKQLHTLIEDEAFDKNKTKQLRPIFKQQQLTSNQIISSYNKSI